MKIPYRAMAARAVDRAKTLIATQSDDTLRYVALELRLALEFITYDRAQAYQEELPQELYGTWQPNKLMLTLIEIDPHADQTSSMSLGLQDTQGAPSEDLNFLGTDNALSLETIKRNYSALGSYLHSPTQKQQNETGGPRFDKLRTRAEHLIEALDKVLSSEIWNVKFGPRLTLQCSWCGRDIVRRVKAEDSEWRIRCLSCGGLHDTTKDKDKRVRTRPLQTQIKCLNGTCGESFFIGTHQVHESAHFACPACSHAHVIQLGVTSSEVTTD